jgi:hypothetical protein
VPAPIRPRVEKCDVAADHRLKSSGIHIRPNAQWEWSGQEVEPRADFASDLLPCSQGVPLIAIVDGTGLSLRYCSVIRRRLKVSHLRYQDMLIRFGLPSGEGSNDQLRGSPDGGSQ